MLSLSSCCSVGSRQSGATLTNEALFRNGSNPFKTQRLDPAALHSSLQPPAQTDHWYQQHCWQTCLLPLRHLYIHTSAALCYGCCTKLSPGLVTRYNGRSCSGLGTALLTAVGVSCPAHSIAQVQPLHSSSQAWLYF